MALKELIPWRWGGLRHWEEHDRPLRAFHREVETLQQEMDRLFEDFFRGSSRLAAPPERPEATALVPQLDITEDDQAYHVSVELPGMDEKDVEVSLADGALMIRGEKKQEDEEKDKDCYRRERRFGSFRRILPLGGEIDEEKIRAAFRKGVLVIDLPKSEAAKQKVRQIAVEAA